MIDLGTVGTPEEAHARLVGEATRFLGAGGVVTWSEWSEMPEQIQDAFVEAAQVVAVDRAAQDVAVRAEIAAAAQESHRIRSALKGEAERLAASPVTL